MGKLPSSSALFSECQDLFERLNLPENQVCKRCEAKIKAPLLPWHVGEEYPSQAERVLIAGKPHRGKPGKELESGALDARARAEDLYFNSSWAYWSYTREILAETYGSYLAGWKRIALTNAVKCTSTQKEDKTSFQTAASCFSKLEVLPREISILQPTTIILYTWHFHKQLFETPFLNQDYTKHTQVTPRDHRVACRNKTIGWWHREFSTSWSENVSLLVTSHPERKGKDEYISLISEWVSENADV